MATRERAALYSEIMLPKDAPPEYKDRQTLWNAVEASERRKDAQLAREIIIAQQREVDLQEQIEILREYIKEKFTDKGMCVDFAIHDKGDGNPHAHIMLTTRHVTPDGFGLKNTEWNKKELFLEWRESWAEVNNHMLERKGLAERIDHRSYKSRGIDREPMVHLGHKDAALERKGIKTERGNHNHEVQRRNAEREAQNLERASESAENAPKELANNETAQKTAEYLLNELKENYVALENPWTSFENSETKSARKSRAYPTAPN